VHRGRRPADSAPGFERLYLAAAGIMILFPAAAFVFTSLFGWQSRLIFWLETLGLWAFSFFWFVKGADLQTARGQRKSRLTKRAEQLLGLRPPGPPRSGDLQNARSSPEMGRVGAAPPEGASLAAREVT
jgi:hypothetical protein